MLTLLKIKELWLSQRPLRQVLVFKSYGKLIYATMMLRQLMSNCHVAIYAVGPSYVLISECITIIVDPLFPFKASIKTLLEIKELWLSQRP